MSVQAPRISVLMPVFNAVPYLSSAIESIRAQTHQDFELIVLDDGSTDASYDVVRTLAERDSRIRLYTRANQGIAATRNELLDLASGEYIAWMDADDISVPQRLETQLRTFAENPGVVCLGSANTCIDAQGWPISVSKFPSKHEDIIRAQTSGGGMRFPTTMMNGDIAKSLGGFRDLRIGEDLDFLIRLGRCGNLMNLDVSLLHYRKHPKSTSVALSTRWIEHRDLILTVNRSKGSATEPQLSVGNLEEVSLGNLHLNWAWEAFHGGFPKSALKHAGRSLCYKPWRVSAWKLVAKVTLGSLQQRFFGTTPRS